MMTSTLWTIATTVTVAVAASAATAWYVKSEQTVSVSTPAAPAASSSQPPAVAAPAASAGPSVAAPVSAAPVAPATPPAVTSHTTVIVRQEPHVRVPSAGRSADLPPVRLTPPYKPAQGQ